MYILLALFKMLHRNTATYKEILLHNNGDLAIIVNAT